MAKPTKLELDIKAWLEDLAGRLPAPGLGLDDGEQQRTVMAQSLAKDLPSAAFTPRSLEMSAAKFEAAFPLYAELKQFLTAWLKEMKPKTGNDLPGGDDPRLSLQDRHVIALFQRQRADNFGRPPGHECRNEMKISLSSMRRTADRAMKWIINSDPDAFVIAKQSGWLDGADPDGWGDPDRLRRSIAAILEPGSTPALEKHCVGLRKAQMQFLHAAIEKHAPELLAIVIEAEDNLPGHVKALVESTPEAADIAREAMAKYTPEDPESAPIAAVLAAAAETPPVPRQPKFAWDDA